MLIFTLNATVWLYKTCKSILILRLKRAGVGMWGRVEEGGSVWLTFTGSNRLTQRWQSGPSIGCWWQGLCAKQRTDAHSPCRTREEGTYGFLSIPQILWTIRQLHIEKCYLSAIARVQDLILIWFPHSQSKRVLESFCFSVKRICRFCNVLLWRTDY